MSSGDQRLWQRVRAAVQRAVRPRLSAMPRRLTVRRQPMQVRRPSQDRLRAMRGPEHRRPLRASLHDMPPTRGGVHRRRLRVPAGNDPLRRRVRCAQHERALWLVRPDLPIRRDVRPRLRHAVRVHEGRLLVLRRALRRHPHRQPELRRVRRGVRQRHDLPARPVRERSSWMRGHLHGGQAVLPQDRHVHATR
jgi:hypothetical protein